MKKEVIAVAVAFCAVTAFCIVGGIAGPILAAAFLAFLLKPFVEKAEEKIKRRAAILIVTGIGLTTVIFALELLVPYLGEQLKQVLENLPSLIKEAEKVLAGIGEIAEKAGVRLKWENLISEERAEERAEERIRQLLTEAGTGTATAGAVATVPMLCYYLLRDREKLAERLGSFLPRSWVETGKRIGRQLDSELWRYFMGQALLALVVGTGVGIGLSVAGIRYALLLGLIVGLLEFVPYFGAYIGAIPVGITALAQGGQSFVWAMVILFAVQQAEGMFLYPAVIGKNSNLHPAAVLLCLIAGSKLFGAAGLVFAVPAVMVMRKIGKTLYDVYLRQKNQKIYRKIN